MRCISLWQPWAALVVIGAKRFETRHWSTRYRGPLAIHAAQIKRSARYHFDVEEVFERSVFQEPLRAAGYRDAKDLAYGAIVGRAQLDACCLVIREGFHFTYELERIEAGEVMLPPPEPELHFGNFTPGRYGWAFSDPRRLTTPVKMTGRQGFWEIDDNLVQGTA
jgi:hypothetical protein